MIHEVIQFLLGLKLACSKRGVGLLKINFLICPTMVGGPS